jgi:hypothetical protein
MLGWYIFAAHILLSVGFVIALPVGELSAVFKGAGDATKNEALAKPPGA